MSITETIQRALASAGLDTNSGAMRHVTETIRRAMSSAGLADGSRAPRGDPPAVDVAARLVDEAPQVEPEPRRKPATGDAQAPGTFTAHQFRGPAGTRAYKLYVPASPPSGRLPMVVMLHGCTQSADDFAAGTQMNRLADAHGFLVVYPEQSSQANPSRCWNWFNAEDQVRDSGEPSLIAGIVREVAAREQVDSRRIFVAGLSAGAAMAVIMGETYPEIFAGVGAHSGLPYGSAHDVPSALAAMKGRGGAIAGMSAPGRPKGEYRSAQHEGARVHGLPGAASALRSKAAQAVPIIVFHGDRDRTVQHANGAEIIAQAIDAHAADAAESALSASTESGKAAGGRTYSRTVHADTAGRPRVESWTLHGGGHAWSGGDASGSYTDRAGPDASAEMVRFFLALPRAGAA